MSKSPVKLKSPRQSEAFTLQPGNSMRYVLILNGVIPEVPTAFPSRQAGEEWLTGQLQAHAPHALPDAQGPISLVLIL
jgi:hypothetical protein